MASTATARLRVVITKDSATKKQASELRTASEPYVKRDRPTVAMKNLAVLDSSQVSQVETTVLQEGSVPVPAEVGTVDPIDMLPCAPADPYVPIDEEAAAWRQRLKRTMDDAAKLQPIPVVAFLQGHSKRRACGRCSECRKPPCGKCATCLQTARNHGAQKRRCMHLKCLKIKESTVRMPPIPAAQEPFPRTQEAITAEMESVCAQLRSAGCCPKSNLESYNHLVVRKTLLHECLVVLRFNNKSDRSQFPVGFPEAWGIISKLEKARFNIARCVCDKIKRGGPTPAMLDCKRSMRDLLDDTIHKFCMEWVDLLTPREDATAISMFKLLLERRRALPTDSDVDALMRDKSAGCVAPPSEADQEDDYSSSSSSSSDDTS